MTRVVVQTFVIEPIWKTESGVASTPVAVLSRPAAKSITSPSLSTAIAAPGTPRSATRRAKSVVRNEAMSSRVRMPSP